MAEIEERASKMLRICALWSQLPREERQAVLWRARALVHKRRWVFYARDHSRIIGKKRQE